ncbi:MAG TPA: ribosomal protein S18-alanine N-acetyltransferase [Alphaproteobacteria bacterium]|nr:ribosomal protein S18-alanine N-acetyltransferase [Alphaproteobacteria bacterium]
MIRPVTKSDAEALTRLHAESFSDAAWSKTQIEGTLALTSTQGWIAIEDDKPAGFILCQVAQEQSEILTFCVAPEFRRKKLGERLLLHARDSVRLKGCLSLFLEVAADNKAAVALYKKLGAKQIGKRPNYYHKADSQIDALMFELSLFASKA